MANPHGDIIAHVKRNNSLVEVHHGSNRYFLLMKNGQVLTRARWPKNTHPNHVWYDIENCDVPKDLEPKLMYQRIKRGLADRNYTGPLTITAIFAKTTEHIPLDMLAKLPPDIRTVDLGLYHADKKELKDAADNAIIKEIKEFWNDPVNDPARCNVMVMSGDKIFVQTLQDLRGKGYRTLAAFRVSSNEEELNDQVWDSWVFRHLLNLPWTVGAKPREEEQDMERKRSSSSAVLQHYCCVSKENKLPALVRFLKNSRDKKVVIFFSSCSSVKYYYEMMRDLDNDLRCLRIHGKLDLEENLQAFQEFKNNVGGLVLLCSDAVALGPHIQGVDWIVRFDMPLKLGHYLFSVVHQAHRNEARALLLLDDAKILGHDAFKKVTLKEMEFDKEELTEVQTQVEELLKKKNKNGKKLRTLAGEANSSVKRRKII